MAVTATTLASACAIDATTIKVAAATGFAKGKYIEVDGELMIQSRDQDSGSTIIPVIRGWNGTYASAHPTSAKCIVGSGYDDFPNAGAASASPSAFPAQPNRPRYSYSAAGALTPSEGLHMLNGTNALAMTLAVPTALQDGQVMTIVGNGKAAHTVTVASGLGGASTGYTLLTFDTLGQCCVQLVAANALWVPCASPYSGTLTAIDVAVS